MPFGKKIFLVLAAVFLTGVFISKFSAKVFSQTSLENLCQDGYYDNCSRAPLCGGLSYDDAANLPAPNAQACMGDGYDARAEKGCAGYVPLCCYEIERTGDPLKCVGYWERLWCHPQNCDAIDPEKSKVCNNGVPGDCGCDDAITSWCLNTDGHDSIPYIPVETRLGINPTATNTPVPPTPTGHPCLLLAKQGDYDCSGTVNDADFTAWKNDFLANKTTLAFFEYWRRAAL